MRDPVPLRRYFNLYKHLCAINVLAAPVFLLFYTLEPVGGGLFVALVLGTFFTSFVLAAGGVNRAMDGIVRPTGWNEREFRRRLSLAAAAFVAGTIGVAVPATVLFVG